MDLPDIKFAGPKSADKAISDKGVVTAVYEGKMSSFNDSFTASIAKHRHRDREKKE